MEGISIFNVIGNGISNQEISNKIIEMLNKKYNQKFLVKRIGNRYGANNTDSVTTYCNPENNEELIFTTTLNKEQTEIEDDYKLRCVEFELEKFMKSIFQKNNIDIIVKVKTIGKNKVENFFKVQEFVDTYNETNFLAHIVGYETITDDTLKKVYELLNAKYRNIYLNNLIYTIDENEFKEFYDITKTLPQINTSLIEQYNIKNEIIIKIKEGRLYKI